jgi:hypothetical protein
MTWRASRFIPLTPVSQAQADARYVSLSARTHCTQFVST